VVTRGTDSLREPTSRAPSAAERWRTAAGESASLALDSLRTQPMRSTLAIGGIVIGIVTVVVVASVLAGVRNSVAELFRDLGTDNVFAYHLSGDPYQPASEREARRKPLEPAFAPEIERLSDAIDTVSVQVIVPPVVSGRALTARAGSNEVDTVLVEGATPNHFEVTGAEFVAGRPFSELENRAAAPVAVIGANLVVALFGEDARGRSVGRQVTLGGDVFYVVGELAPRKGGFFGENRNDNVFTIPLATATRRFPQAEDTVLYMKAKQGRRDDARVQAEFVLRQLRRLGADRENDFNLSTSEQIIANLDRVSSAIAAVTVGLAGISLFIGGIGIANVMLISVTERTREIGVRLALGARRREVLRQFLLEAVLLSSIGGLAGLAIASLLGVIITFAAPALSAMPPLWVVVAGFVGAVLTGVVAGYWPASRAARLDPVEALRYE
jgi:putative ABC transport system permease protein